MVGVGGSIPFMGLFQKQHPKAEFLITGCVSPENNLHAADENFNVDYGSKLFKLLGYILVKCSSDWKAKPEKKKWW